ncbi:hypothetical protein HF638_21230 [Paenibacillus sp. SZ31]|uniref:hypothetical protein n=1 Tax=Paenibacillus sp. SZ31 TaxID=2725555 RepID=UPI00146BAEC7|nr:hypothetical protein [Paenibacillus sp. SZ31]NMI06511.1 hypothetical protein [Paenibacillus sp. SZ31]
MRDILFVLLYTAILAAIVSYGYQIYASRQQVKAYKQMEETQKELKRKFEEMS